MVEKKLRKYLIPNIFAMMGTSCYLLADTFFISSSGGANGITALNLTLPIYGAMFAIGSMIGVGSATRYSLCKALGDNDANDYLFQSLLWTVLFSSVFVLLGIFSPDGVLMLMGADNVILKTGVSYMKIILCFAPTFMMSYTYTSFVRNDNAPKLAMSATVFSNLFNIIFDYIFMFPMKMGMKGAALATGLAPLVSMGICASHFFSEKNNLRIICKGPSIKKLGIACSLGIAGFVGEIARAITSMTFNFILLHLAGNIAVAAYGVVANLSLIAISIFDGISQGLQPLASEAEGTGNSDAKKRIVKHSLQIGVGIAAVLVLVYSVFAKEIVAVFNSENSTKMASYAVNGLRLYSIGFLIAVVNIVRAGFFSAIGRAKECSVISITRGIIANVFFVFTLPKMFGIYGVWLSFPVSEIFTFIVSLIFVKNKNNVPKIK